jgi:hypothetical protein
MRIKKNTKRTSTVDGSYFGNISKNSIKKDFKDSGVKKEINEVPQDGAERRVLSISERSDYYKKRHLIIGKLIKIVDHSSIGFNSFVCSFVFEEDRKLLNNALGYTDKKEYLFEGIKFK